MEPINKEEQKRYQRWLDRKNTEEAIRNRRAAWRVTRKAVKWTLITAGAVAIYNTVKTEKDETNQVES